MVLCQILRTLWIPECIGWLHYRPLRPQLPTVCVIAGIQRRRPYYRALRSHHGCRGWYFRELPMDLRRHGSCDFFSGDAVLQPRVAPVRRFSPRDCCAARYHNEWYRTKYQERRSSRNASFGSISRPLRFRRPGPAVVDVAGLQRHRKLISIILSYWRGWSSYVHFVNECTNKHIHIDQFFPKQQPQHNHYRGRCHMRCARTSHSGSPASAPPPPTQKCRDVRYCPPAISTHREFGPQRRCHIKFTTVRHGEIQHRPSVPPTREDGTKWIPGPPAIVTEPQA
ncbi:hypothetical protein K438DRAFT_127268 [Mycena galopus ATCC 62051]|nr:hypothetical protein K438DRAFT_127268 [Mycena galopus ATCC 62051]